MNGNQVEQIPKDTALRNTDKANLTSNELPGTNTLLMGPSGNGKTNCLQTLIECGITPFILSLEPGIGEVLGHIPADKLHWKYIVGASAGWDDLIRAAELVNTLSFESLTRMTDPNKGMYGQFIDVLKTLSNFVCDRDGKSYGMIDNWGTDRALVIDSLSGLNIMSMNLTVGIKPVKAPGEWQVAQDNIQKIIYKLCMQTRCHFILTAHVERELNPVTGETKVMVSTIGKALAPVLPRFFSDVIYLIREGSNFRWSNMAGGVDTKTRNLPFSDKLEPSFVPLIQKWKSKGGVIKPSFNQQK